MKRNKSVKDILKAYDDQNSYTVISFKNDLRVMTYAHLDPLHAIGYVQEQNLAGHDCLVFKESQLTCMEAIERPKKFFTDKLEQLKQSSINDK